MSGHTKGPWESVATGDGTFGIIAEHQPLAIPMNDIACIWPRGGKKRTASNARLIAAAPDLLEALQELVRWYAKRETASTHVSGGEGLLPIEHQDDEIRAAMHAVARATGDQP